MVKFEAQQENSSLIGRKTAHPWDEQCNSQYATFPTPETPDFDGMESINLNLFDDIDLNPSNIEFDIFDCDKANVDHSYASSLKSNDLINISDKENSSDEDAGICLHVSKQRLSIEFCQMCSDNSKNSEGLY